MHSGPFGCLTKLDAKRAKLVQKFVPQSRVEIFHNERAQSTPLDRKLTFWCILYHRCAFGNIGWLTKLGAKQAELVQKFVPRSRVGTFRNERIRSTPFDLKLTFWCVSYHLGAFGTIWLPHELVQKFVPRSRIGIFATNAPDPPHSTIN